MDFLGNFKQGKTQAKNFYKKLKKELNYTNLSAKLHFLIRWHFLSYKSIKSVRKLRKSIKIGEVKTQGKLKDQGKPQNSGSTSRRHFSLPNLYYVKKILTNNIIVKIRGGEYYIQIGHQGALYYINFQNRQSPVQIMYIFRYLYYILLLHI